MKNAPHSSRAGFTFVELMLVIAIMTLVAGVVWPSLSRSMPLLAVRGAARTVAAFSQRASSEAVAQAVKFRLTINVSEGSIQITGELEPFDQPGQFIEIQAPWGREIKLGDRVRVEEVALEHDDGDETMTSGDCALLFLPDGTATQARITLRADDGSQIWVTIRGVTGQVGISEEQPS